MARKPNQKGFMSASATIEVAEWNKRHPVGTNVRFWRMLREGPGETGVTRAPAEVRNGTAVVWLEGMTGCVFLDNVEVMR